MTGGQTIQLYPLPFPSRFYPPLLYGLHRICALRRLDTQVDLHHVYYGDLYPFPVLRLLRKPVVYAVMAGAERNTRPAALTAWPDRSRIVVSNRRDAEQLAARGVAPVTIIPPAIDTAAFDYTPPPVPRPFTLLMASAPWVRGQFKLKGVDVLLEAAARMPDLKLILLWRGLLLDELVRRIERFNVTDRVTVINERVDVNTLLAKSHAAIVMAQTAKIVKAWPHSLMESLAAGKPVLVSRAVPMSDFVSENRCGVVIPHVDTGSLMHALNVLRRHYSVLQRHALETGRRAFDRERFTAAYRALYAEVCGFGKQ
jgi:glycosyltransferase involved in cell wall biosynthesis